MAELRSDMPTHEPIPPLYLAGALLAMVALHRLAPRPRLLPRPFNRLGILDILAGMALGVWAFVQFRRTGTTIEPAGEPTTLITTGPFRYTRNPLYLAMVAILSGTATLLGSLLPFAAIPPFIWLITTRVIPLEERNLERTFGEQYRRYQAAVPRWL